MITTRGIFYMVYFIGLWCIVMFLVTAVQGNYLEHVSLMKMDNLDHEYYHHIDYLRLILYLIVWSVSVFVCYKISKEINLKAK